MTHNPHVPRRSGLALALAFTGLAVTGPAFAAGELTIAMRASQEPASLDGHIDPYQSTWLFNSFVADPLLILSPDGIYMPALATSWEASDDGKEWTFNLRDDVTFQDGTPFNADALKYNLERIAAPETASKQLRNDIGPFTSIEVIDATTVRITYDTPWVTLLDALRRTPIWSPAALEEHGDQFDRHLVGTGPFTLEEWVPNDHITFARWADYGGWNSIMSEPGPASVDSVEIRFIGEAVVLGSLVQTGDADIAFAITPQYVEDYRNVDGYQYYAKDQAGTGLQMVMNIRKPPLNDIRVRQALNFAADQEAVNDLLYDGAYSASDGPLNNVHHCFWEEATAMYATDLDRAAALLDEAGWRDEDGDGFREAHGVEGVADGEPLSIDYNILHHKEIGEALQAQFRQVGIDLNVEQVPGPVQLDRVQSRTFELMYERQRSPDPLILDQVWNSKWDEPGGWAWTGYVDPDLDATLGKLRAVPDLEARCEAARQAQKIIMENALMLPTLSDPVFVAMNDRVKGFQPGSEGNWFFLHNVSVED